MVFNSFVHLSTEVFFRNRVRNYFLFREVAPFAGFLSKEIRKNIAFYTLQGSITNLWFSTLRGFQVNQKENVCGVYIGVVTALYDNMLDSLEYSHEELKNKLIAPADEKSTKVFLLNHYDTKLNSLISNPAEFKKYYEKIILAQQESMRQTSAIKLKEVELRKLTYDKGGYATLLFRSILSNDLKEGEEDAIYYLGALLQLINDIFDIYKDLQSGQQTLASTASDFHFLHSEFNKLKELTVLKFSGLNYPLMNRKKALMLVFPVISRGVVCLEQLIKLQGDQTSIDLKAFTRKELVCDMEKFSAIKRSFQICKTWSKELTKI